MLSLEVARAIVSKIMTVLGRNINIMDETGVIIASGDPLRVGTFHEVSAQVIKSNKVFEINTNKAAELKGVCPGINVPITFENSVVGVVGITGEPDDVRNYAQLVRYTAELMLEQASFKEQVHLKERAREIYLQELVSGNWGEDSEVFIHRGSLIGFNLNVPRAVMVLDFEQYSEALKGEIDLLSTSDQFLFHHKLEGVLTNLRIYFNSQPGIAGFVGANKIIILPRISLDISAKQRRLELTKLAKTVLNIAEDYTGHRVLTGIGRYFPGLEGLRKSYLESLKAIELGMLFDSTKNIYFFEDQSLENVINEIPVNQRREFYNNFFKDFIDASKSDPNNNQYNKDLLQTLKVFFDENLNVKKTSERLFVHRNTVIHRLKKIQVITGLNPSNFRDAFYLKLALMFFFSEEGP